LNHGPMKTRQVLFAVLVLSLILIGILVPPVCADKEFTLSVGEIDTEVLEGNEEVEVFITVISPNASIDVYVLPTELYAMNQDLQDDFEPLDQYTKLNLTTNITYSFKFFEDNDEFSRFSVILDNSDNFKENDTVPSLNETIHVVIYIDFPSEEAKATIYKGVIAAFIVAIFCGAVVAKSIRERILKKNGKTGKRAK